MRLLLIAAAFSTGAAATLSAQVKKDSVAAQRLDEVVVSVTHVRDSVQNLPVSVGVISPGILQRSNATDITSAMNTVAGVYMQSANITTTRISIRGIGARTAYGTNKIRAFFGNIPLTSGNSETTIDDLDLENLSNVEIIKGPLTSVYGAGLGGAILLNPAMPALNGQLFETSSVFGSYGLMKNRIRYAIDSGQGSLNVNYHHIETDGWRQNSNFRREGMTLSGELFRKGSSKLTYIGNFTDLKAYLPSSIDQTTFENNPRNAAATWLASKGYKDYKSLLAGLSYETGLGSGIRNVTSVSVNYRDNVEARPFDILKQYTLAVDLRTQFSADFKVGKLPGEALAGIEYFKDYYAGRTFENLYQDNGGKGSLEGGRLTAETQRRDFYNAFMQAGISLSKRWKLRGGLNVNRTYFSLDPEAPEGAKEKYSYKGIFSPSGSLTYKAAADHNLYATVSKGFSLPSVEETLAADGTVNANIKPETGANYEVGAKSFWLGRKLYTEIALYTMEIENLLVAKRVGDDQYVGVNAGSTRHRGIEFSANGKWGNKTLDFQPYVSVSYGEYRFVDYKDGDNDFSGNRLANVPSSRFSAGLKMVSALGLYLNADYRFTDRLALNDSNSAYAAAWNTTDLALGYEWRGIRNFTASVAFGVNNVTDTKYASMILPNATAFAPAQPRYYYPGLPVNYYGMLSFDYKL